MSSLVGIRKYMLKKRAFISILSSRIPDLFIYAKNRLKKFITVKRKSEGNRLSTGELENIERLGRSQIDEYVDKARLVLIETAKRRTLITYDTLMHKLGHGPGRTFSGDVVRKVSELELAEGRPRLSAVVIRSDTRMVGGGFFGLPNTPDSVKRSKWEEWSNPQLSSEEQEYWHNELRKVYDYWCPEFR
jgi:hypothetical protein